MIFSNPEFFAFFGIFVALYFAVRRKLALQNLLILVGSYIFYGWWDPRFLILIAVSSGADYLAGIAAAGQRIQRREVYWAAGSVAALAAILAAMRVESLAFILPGAAIFVLAALLSPLLLNGRPQAQRKRAALWVSILVNLGILGFFKYFNFFTENFVTLFETIGFRPDFFTVSVLLPVGISFYTFQTMSYTLDVHAGRMSPTRDFIRFAAYVSFFPQLVAGPIERAKHLLPQFDRLRILDWGQIQSGAMLFLWGYYKKTVIADNLAPIADAAFTDPTANTAGLLAGVLAFSFQIYCDFSGYTDMARGAARILGFDVMRNFRMPYFSRTPSEFWQRWHISLSSWLRDYLYIPLGGNRGGTLMTYRNLMLTMVIGGLWHGAAWTFVFWGFIHGMLLIMARLGQIDERLAKIDYHRAGGFAVHALAAFAMFAAAAMAWIPFRAASFTDSAFIMTHLFAAAPTGLATIGFYVGPLLTLELVTRLRGQQNPWDGVKGWTFYTLVLFLLYASLLLQSASGQAFIYFDF